MGMFYTAPASPADSLPLEATLSLNGPERLYIFFGLALLIFMTLMWCASRSKSRNRHNKRSGDAPASIPPGPLQQEQNLHAQSQKIQLSLIHI